MREAAMAGAATPPETAGTSYAGGAPGISPTWKPTRRGDCPRVSWRKDLTSVTRKSSCCRDDSVSQRYDFALMVMVKHVTREPDEDDDEGFRCGLCTSSARRSPKAHVLPMEKVPLVLRFDLWILTCPSLWTVVGGKDEGTAREQRWDNSHPTSELCASVCLPVSLSLCLSVSLCRPPVSSHHSPAKRMYLGFLLS